jgi:surface protein
MPAYSKAQLPSGSITFFVLDYPFLIFVMKRNLLLLFFAGFMVLRTMATPLHKEAASSQAATAITDGFITTWRTDAANQAIVIPINTTYAGQYNYTVNWGDGNIINNQTANATHTYASPGTHSVTITGDFPAIDMYNTISVSGNNQRLLTVEQWGNGSWKGMENAFRFCQNLTTVPNANGPIFEPNASLNSMFYDCSGLNCDLNLWDMTNVINISQMFRGATAFNGNLADWNVANVTNMTNLFDKALVFNRDISKWDVSKVKLMDNMFTNARAFNGDISKWNVGSVTSMNNMFGLALTFNQDIGQWDVSKVTNMFFMFSNAPAFNQNLNSWDVSRVTDMSYMFQGDGVFNGDIHSWNVGSVTNMIGMFSSASAFNQDISGWDVRKVVSMSGMFASASSFNQNISGWQTNALTQMDHMFNLASAFNQNIGSWNVANVTSMNSAFSQATAFNQNLGNWQVGKVIDMANMLDGTGLSAINYESTLAGWATETLKTGISLGVAGLRYCATSARQHLINTDSWQIVGDRPVCLVPAVPDGAGIVYVDSAVVTPGDGSSWTSALQYLSDATESAKTNTAIKEVHIAKGTYYPTGDKDLLYSDSAFVLTRPGLKILGGYANGGAGHDINAYPTILSGDLGLADDSADNANNVLIIRDVAGTVDSLIVDGLTIANGNAIFDFNDFDNVNYAGGICLNHVFANTVLRNCIIRNNYGMLGSALSISGPLTVYTDPSQISTPQIQNCIITNNTVAPIPGLPLMVGSTCICTAASPMISHCDFTDNKAILGGAFENSGGTPVFYNCRFMRDTAIGLSGIYNVQNGGTVLINCAILDNINLGYTSTADPNTASLNSNAVIGNLMDATCRLINTTIAGNKSLISPTTDRPLIYNIKESASYITNSIIWGNTTNTVLDSLTSVPSKIAYSLLEGQGAVPANHVLDGSSNPPVFVDLTGSDYHLMTGSVAMDAGLDDSLTQALQLYLPTITGGGLDLAGAARFNGAAIDLGAYEFASSGPLPVTLQVFKGTLQNGVADLRWTSGVEAGLKDYTVERGTDGKSFNKLGVVAATGSNSQYGFKTAQVTPTAYYRLQMTDQNGKTSYSAIIKITQNKAPEGGFLVYPNPAKDYLHIQTDRQGKLLIYDASGRLAKALQLKAGTSTIDISGLGAGSYFAVLEAVHLNGEKMQGKRQAFIIK